MTPQQKDSLLASAKRLGLSLSLFVAVAGWGFRQYDATNVPARDFRAYRDSMQMRYALDSLRAGYEFQSLSRAQLRTDSAVRKVCQAVRAGC